ncbi:UDP-glucuronate 4-epimerase 3 [Olea europaea subsp. europaea]|uniref:UDP-glucuronate 4-epimerase 3 n=1 Tax=Olea europaea subsp. europaea TaxID=158383 RepID=A0A8S0RM99_OLEEU|nr:UDP-glucuronate 4-epimerase 3 [Olea europaea subsp. europaea]
MSRLPSSAVVMAFLGSIISMIIMIHPLRGRDKRTWSAQGCTLLRAGVRYAMENPSSYVHSNIAGLVSVLEVCKSVNPQPVIVWASSSSVYGLNTKVPFTERDRTDQPASLYAATKKADEEIAHTYNHIYGLSLTGLRDILKGNSIPIFEAANHGTVARDFTYIDAIVKGCLAALDTAEKSIGSGGKKKGPAQLWVYNLGNTSPVPVSYLVSILERLLKVKAKRLLMNLPRNGDVQFTHANISLVQNELGYKPTTNLQMGLKKFVQWYLRYYGFFLRCKRSSAPRATADSSKTSAVMGRMHSRGKGISASALPYKRTPPSWLKISSQDVRNCTSPSLLLITIQNNLFHLAPSVQFKKLPAQVKSVTGSKILRILKGHGLAPEIPEDLYHLIKKAVAIRKHLERNRKDKDSKFRLILVESRIHRLARYYKKTKKLPPVWKYESTTASTLVA